MKNTTVSKIAKHEYICDLINVDGPILSLYKDTHHNWLYLWADVDENGANSWVLFSIKRNDLVDYLNKAISLRKAFFAAKDMFWLSQSMTQSDHSKARIQRQLKIAVPKELEKYAPSADAFFDESLTNDIRVDLELNPSKFNLPIDGNWFVRDLDKFSGTYDRLYAFFYCTRPRFVTNIGGRFSEYLRAPWRGGFSRLNLLDALQRTIPSLHATKIQSIQYASPGAISIDALESVNSQIIKSVNNYLETENEVADNQKVIDAIFSKYRFRKKDLSNASDNALEMTDEHLKLLKDKMSSIAKLLEIEQEINNLTTRSPNSVVSTKVMLAVVAQIKKFSEFEKMGLLDISNKDSAELHVWDE